MCVIIIKQQGKKLSKEVLKTSARINPHGLGVIWLDTFEITYHKSKRYDVLDTDRPFIAHFRYATVGAIGLQNTHPFRCGNNKHEWLMMNGTIKGMGNANVCDTKVLAESLGNVDRSLWRNKLEMYECRFVTVNVRNRTFQIYNKEDWHQKDGVWFSKDNVLEDTLVAVYGTLKKGYSNYHSYLTGSKYLGGGNTKEKYPLIVKGLPYLIEDSGKGYNVEVDVFKVSASVLSKLDKLEGHPNWYRRKQVDIVVGGKTLSCWIYFNIKETSAGHVFHQTYKPQDLWFRPMERNHSFSHYENDAWYEEAFDYMDDTEFNVSDEKPVCVECYHDLEHDGFANYHCGGCDMWFAEDEVVIFQR
jgi:gamma-glutamylaminecyclotransferase